MKNIALYSLIILFNNQILFAQNNLNYFINAATQNSPLIQDNKNQNEAYKFEIERLKAFYTKPQITFNAGIAVSPIINNDNGISKFQISPSDATNYIGYDVAASNGGTYQGMLNINQPLFYSAKYKMASEQVMVAGQINQNTIKLSEHDIEKIVGDQYILCIQDLKQTDYIEQLTQLISEQKLIVSKLVESGLLKQSDLLLVNIEEQTQLNNLSFFKSTYQRDLMDLNILCGINDTAIVKLLDIKLYLNSPTNQSNFIEKFRLDSLNIVAGQKNFELKYKPQLNSFANAGLNGVYVPTLPNRFGVSAGLNFSLTIFDGKQKELNKKKTDLFIKSTQSYKSNFISQNYIRKNKILLEITSLNQRITISENQLKDYKQLLEYYKMEVITGQQSVTTYITTIKSIATLQKDFVLMQTNKQLLINIYNYWNW